MKILALLTLISVSFPSQARATTFEAQFTELTDRYFDDYFRHHPSEGTSAGFHEYDTQLENYSRQDVTAQITTAKTFLKAVRALGAQAHSQEQGADVELVTSQIQSRLHELEQVRSWERNPDLYSSGVSSSIFSIISRDFAPQTQRMQSVIAREKQIPGVFAAARSNLKNPPRIFTEVALEQISGIISFFKVDVPAALKDVKDKVLLTEFQTWNQKVIDELGAYEKFLRQDLLPRSKGVFQLGKEKFRLKLRYDEMVDMTLESLLKVGYDNLRQNQKLFAETAAKIDPERKPLEVLAEVAKDHPAPAKLLEAFRDTLGGIVAFIEEHHIVTIPSTVRPTLEETPPFARALTFASMDTPGPFEKIAKEAYFNVTLPETSWPASRTEEHMQGFSRGTILSTAIHEAYPGHYVQFLWLHNVKSKVRKLLGCASNAEGWAHYTEQMMLDEGFTANDPKIRLGQLQDALLRNARFIVSIEMHTGKMTFEQAIDFFVKEGYQSRANGERETKRGTSDPTYLYYTLGKLEILKLREDYRKLKGKDFSLQQFHDEFLKQGFPPIKLIRRALLGRDGPML